MSGRPDVVVYVDRNAIWENDRDGGDRPAILLELPGGQQERVHAVEITGTTRVVQNGKDCECQQHRPHVWLEVFGPYRATSRGR